MFSSRLFFFGSMEDLWYVLFYHLWSSLSHKVLGWPESLSGFFCTTSWKNPNELFDQPNTPKGHDCSEACQVIFINKTTYRPAVTPAANSSQLYPSMENMLWPMGTVSPEEGLGGFTPSLGWPAATAGLIWR